MAFWERPVPAQLVPQYQYFYAARNSAANKRAAGLLFEHEGLSLNLLQTN
jgi:hypothetical protein